MIVPEVIEQTRILVHEFKNSIAGLFTVNNEAFFEKDKGYYGALIVKPTKRIQNAISTNREILVVFTDIPQMTSKFVEIVPPFHGKENCIPSAAIRWPDFGDRSSFARPFARIFRHSDTPLLSF